MGCCSGSLVCLGAASCNSTPALLLIILPAVLTLWSLDFTNFIKIDLSLNVDMCQSSQRCMSWQFWTSYLDHFVTCSPLKVPSWFSVRSSLPRLWDVCFSSNTFQAHNVSIIQKCSGCRSKNLFRACLKMRVLASSFVTWGLFMAHLFSFGTKKVVIG